MNSFSMPHCMSSPHWAFSPIATQVQRPTQRVILLQSSRSSALHAQQSQVSLSRGRQFVPPSAAGNGASANSSPDQESYDEFCAPAYVFVDNRKNPNFTVMDIEVQDYPGLLRVLAWVLNGLEMVAQNAILSTNNDGVAHNTLWLSTRRGRKLSDAAADLLAERVREFLTYCSPRPEENEQTEFTLGPISVSNVEHSQYTVVTVRETRRTPGFLLEVASVLSGLNVQVRQGVIQVSNFSKAVWSLCISPFLNIANL